MKCVIVPYNRLEPQTLQNLVKEFVTRDGTDYGEVEISLEIKMDQVMARLRDEKAVVVFDLVTKTANILAADNPHIKDAFE